MAVSALRSTAVPASVLIVDSDARVLEQLRTALETSGYRVLTTTSSAEAQWLIDEHHVDLVVSTAAAMRMSRADHAWPEEVAQMSPRMRQTFEALMTGASEKQIAAKLQISPHTTHQYIKTLFRTFGVTSRPELMARVLRR